MLMVCIGAPCELWVRDGVGRATIRGGYHRVINRGEIRGQERRTDDGAVSGAVRLEPTDDEPVTVDRHSGRSGITVVSATAAVTAAVTAAPTAVTAASAAAAAGCQSAGRSRLCYREREG